MKIPNKVQRYYFELTGLRLEDVAKPYGSFVLYSDYEKLLNELQNYKKLYGELENIEVPEGIQIVFHKIPRDQLIKDALDAMKAKEAPPDSWVSAARKYFKGKLK